MSKRDLGNKLRTRLGEWESYGEKPSIGPPPASTLNVPCDGPLSATAETPARSGSARTDNADSAPVHPAEQVEDLKAALDHERQQSRVLLDVVAREQVLHAVTLHARVHSEPSPSVVLERRPAEQNRMRPYVATGRTAPQTYVALIVMVLLIAVGCTCFAYTLLR